MDLGSMLSNPQMMNMVGQMMADPNIQNMLVSYFSRRVFFSCFYYVFWSLVGSLSYIGVAGGGGGYPPPLNSDTRPYSSEKLPPPPLWIQKKSAKIGKNGCFIVFFGQKLAYFVKNFAQFLPPLEFKIFYIVKKFSPPPPLNSAEQHLCFPMFYVFPVLQKE